MSIRKMAAAIAKKKFADLCNTEEFRQLLFRDQVDRNRELRDMLRVQAGSPGRIRFASSYDRTIGYSMTVSDEDEIFKLIEKFGK